MPPRKTPKPISPGRPLSRKHGKNEPISKMYIYTEGKITEPEYIYDFYKDICKRKRVILAPIVRAAGVPYTLVSACVQKKNEVRKAAKTDSFEKNSSIWAVFDVDVHPRLSDAIALADAHGIRCAISNPCIEVWGLFHLSLHERPSGRHEAQAELSRVMKGYHHDDAPTFPWDICRDLSRKAMENARIAKQRREEEGGKFPHCNPSSNFHELLIALLADEDEEKI